MVTKKKSLKKQKKIKAIKKTPARKIGKVKKATPKKKAQKALPKPAKKKQVKKEVKKPIKKKIIKKEVKVQGKAPKKVIEFKKPIKAVKEAIKKEIKKTLTKKISKKGVKEKDKAELKTVKRIVEEAKYSHDTNKPVEYEKNNCSTPCVCDPYKTPIDPPHCYLKDRVILLVIDPKMIYTYWEIKPETFYEGKNRIGHDSDLTLRIYDVTNLESFNGYNAHYSWDVKVNDLIGGWYLRLGSSDKSLVVDIGVKNHNGAFYTLVRSNYNLVPRDTIAPAGKIYWMTVNELGEAIITEVEDFTDADLELLRRMLGEELCRMLMEGRYKEFMGASKVKENIFNIPDTLGGASDFASVKKVNTAADLIDPKE